MRAPILPYYGDQFSGVKPPTPALSPCALGFTSAYTVPSVAGDGSYFILTTTTLNYYNKSRTLVWSLSATAVTIGSAMTNFLGLFYSSGQYYALTWRTGNIGLIVLSNPYVANTWAAASIAIPVTATISATLQYGYCAPYNGNYRYRFISSGVIYDVVFSASAKISETTPTQNNGQSIAISALVTLVPYETTDGTIQAIIYDDQSTARDYTLVVSRNGKVASMPVTWLMRSSSNGGQLYPVWLDTSILFACTSGVMPKGMYQVLRSDLDRYLKDICDAMGI